MALSIIKPDSRGTYRLVAEHDLYLDETQTKIIVVRDGEEVPKEAAFVLAGKGGTIPARYEALLKSLDKPEVKDEVKAEEKVEANPKPQPVPEVESAPEAASQPNPETKPEPKPESPAKSKK